MNKGLLIVLGLAVVGGGAFAINQRSGSADTSTPPSTAVSPRPAVPATPTAPAAAPATTPVDLIPTELRGTWFRPNRSTDDYTRIVLEGSKLRLFKNFQRSQGAKIEEVPAGVFDIVFVKQESRNEWIIDGTAKNQFNALDTWRYLAHLADPQDISKTINVPNAITKRYLALFEVKDDGTNRNVVIDSIDLHTISFFMPKDDFDKWGEALLNHYSRL